MNLTFEAILSIFIIILFLAPVIYFKNNYNSYDNIKNYWVYYYNKVKYNESFRKCLVKENCNLEGVLSFNCTSNKENASFNNKLLKNAVSFYIIGYNSHYCPTLVIFDVDTYNDLNLN